eukprot:363585-Chlamydomonas_euryale.AAC.3
MYIPPLSASLGTCSHLMIPARAYTPTTSHLIRSPIVDKKQSSNPAACSHLSIPQVLPLPPQNIHHVLSSTGANSSSMQLPFHSSRPGPSKVRSTLLPPHLIRSCAVDEQYSSSMYPSVSAPSGPDTAVASNSTTFGWPWSCAQCLRLCVWGRGRKRARP